MCRRRLDDSGIDQADGDADGGNFGAGGRCLKGQPGMSTSISRPRRRTTGVDGRFAGSRALRRERRRRRDGARRPSRRRGAVGPPRGVAGRRHRDGADARRRPVPLPPPRPLRPVLVLVRVPVARRAPGSSVATICSPRWSCRRRPASTRCRPPTGSRTRRSRCCTRAGCWRRRCCSRASATPIAALACRFCAIGTSLKEGRTLARKTPGAAGRGRGGGGASRRCRAAGADHRDARVG